MGVLVAVKLSVSKLPLGDLGGEVGFDELFGGGVAGGAAAALGGGGEELLGEGVGGLAAEAWWLDFGAGRGCLSSRG